VNNRAIVGQASLKEGQEEVAKQLLGCAEHAITCLHQMQAHLQCSATELEKISQNLIQKMKERGLGSRARQLSEAMLVRVARLISVRRVGKAVAGASNAEPDKENSHKNAKGSAKSAASKTSGQEVGAIVDWKDALNALTEQPDVCKDVPKDESALVVSCFVNLATFALQQPPAGLSPHPVLRICGSGCLRWLQHLAVLDADMSQRLAGTLSKLTTKAASLADSAASDKNDDVDAALELRELSLVYLAACGRVHLAEVVAQVVKTAKFYDSKPGVRGTNRMAIFHTRLLERLSPLLLQLQLEHTTHEQAPALALADWAAAYALSQARNFKAPSPTTPRKHGVGSRVFAKRMEELLVDIGAASEDEWPCSLLAAVEVIEALLQVAESVCSASSAAALHAALEDRARECRAALESSLQVCQSGPMSPEKSPYD